MRLTIILGNTYARSAEYYLRRRYKSKAKLEKLVKVAITREVANEAQTELDELAHKSKGI